MKKRFLIIFVFFVCILIFGIYLYSRKASSPISNPQEPNSASTSKQVQVPSQAISSSGSSVLSSISTIIKGYEPWKGGRATSLDDPRWKIINERDKSDPKWQWKMPIEFFGRVLDDKHNPISNVKVSFVWNDLSMEGTSKKDTFSDANGNFSLNGVKGKGLSVTLEKDGYLPFDSKNHYSFEYAGVWEKNFHEPNSLQPVIFYMHEKGVTEPLIYQQQEKTVAVGAPVEFRLTDSTTLHCNLLANDSQGEGKWELETSISNGGIQVSTDEFVLQAPQSGYSSKIILTQTTPKPPKWQLYQGGQFYLQAGNNYGRLEITSVLGNDWLRIKVWLNPKADSHNIEVNPEKVIKK